MRDKSFAFRRSKVWSHVMLGAAVTSCAVVVALLAVLLVYIAARGLPALNLAFFTQVPTGDPEAPGGMAHALAGTAVLLGLASVVGIPTGILCGIYLSEFQRDRMLPGIVRFVADVLAGVPSIVTGILGYELLVVPLGRYNGFAGALALAFLMVPLIARTTEEMLRLVPHSLREGALALGASRSGTILRVVVPTAFGSMLTGVMLAIARIAGETAPLLFTALGSRLLTLDPTQPFPSLTAQIFAYATGPYEKQRALAWGGILTLVTALFLVQLAVRLTVQSMSPGRPGKAPA